MPGSRYVCVEGWSSKQVASWLKEQGFCEYVDLLCSKHRLDGASMLCLSETDLRSPPLELKVLGDIKRLMLAVRRLQRQHTALSYLVSEVNALSPIHTVGLDHTVCNSFAERGSGNYQHCNGVGAVTTVGGEHSTGYSNGKRKQNSGRLDPEYWKTALGALYAMLVCGVTSFVMVLVHERVPDMQMYPPLPDIFLDRSILFRRLCSLMGTVFLLRCVTMFVTSLSVPGHHLQCSGKMYGDIWTKVQRALDIWSGLGMSLTGVQTCGDYMFSGHTVVLTMLNFFVTEYMPRNWNFIHTMSWVLNLFGIFFILAAHEHYSIDVFIAFYITTRLFLYYHTLANTQAYQHSRRARIWFPLFSFFECNVTRPVPNVYSWPFPKPILMKKIIG
ncbi:sphingomyelin synthase-related protein 1-like isoform X2 [Xyrauchen texanus]|uniref:sphingomyelin synthase-related protein 1-like isoform X2 n=1 Tax=Xyrauchen texanus TaxID=154827 RepID=UPI002241C008|nr:sphingomyelin synthase-related protein 1-like isoform X2 [Xyrauchen texanus]